MKLKLKCIHNDGEFTIRAPHGGVFVVFAMNKVLPFFITLLIAGAISAALIVLVTKPQEEA